MRARRALPTQRRRARAGRPERGAARAVGRDEVVEAGPTAEDLGEGLFGYHLDFPGNPLEAGCDYEEWARAAAAGAAPTTYAHVTTEAGRDDRLALQYWFFYPFNDYTNKHEGDWEMVQLVFAADDAAEALDQTPLEVGYSQHEGLEVAAVGRPEARDRRRHPPGRARRRRLARQLLRRRALPRHVRRAGVRLRRHPRPGRRPAASPSPSSPSDPAAAQAEFPWIGFEGRWGQREEAFYNGPTGPNTKDELDPPDQLPGAEGPRPQLRRARRRPVRHLGHRLLLQTRSPAGPRSSASSSTTPSRLLLDPGRCSSLLVVWLAPPHHLDARSRPCASPGDGPPGS